MLNLDEDKYKIESTMLNLDEDKYNLQLPSMVKVDGYKLGITIPTDVTMQYWILVNITIVNVSANRK